MIRHWENWDSGEIAREVDQYWHESKTEQEWRRTVVRDMVKVLPLEMGILDVGCGSGAIYEELIKHGFGTSRPYVGGDTSTKMLEIAHNRFPAAQFMAMDIFNLPFKDHSQPIVLCINVLQHLPGYWLALAELARVTGSMLYITTWFKRGRQNNIRLVKSQWGPDFYQNEYSLRPFQDFARGIEGVKGIDTRCLCRSKYAFGVKGITRLTPATFRVLIEKEEHGEAKDIK